ncbi:MAG: hypothetical protein GC159_01190 [Phycisphaera sp.]|nr:hypothetical protein [Phycisphaera sp.]
MTRRTSIALMVALFGFGGLAGVAHGASDAQNKKLVVGKWGFSFGPISNTVEYKADGKYVCTGTAPSPDGGTMKYEHSGTWTLKDGKLDMEVKKSSKPDMIPVGMKTSGKIVKVDDQSLQINDNGNEIEYRRMK